MQQSKDGALGERMVAAGVAASVLGTILGLVAMFQNGFWIGFFSFVVSNVIGFLLTSIGSHKAGRGVWAAIKGLTQSTKRVPDQWVHSGALQISEFVPPTAVSICLEFELASENLNTPLKIRVSSEPNGFGLTAVGSGELGSLTLMVSGTDKIYYSVSHPSIHAILRCTGWEDAV